jgi:hypothetical protein
MKGESMYLPNLPHIESTPAVFAKGLVSMYSFQPSKNFYTSA